MNFTTQIQNIFQTYAVEWTLVIHHHLSRELRYTALGQEISIDTNVDTRTVITLVKNAKKIQLKGESMRKKRSILLEETKENED